MSAQKQREQNDARAHYLIETEHKQTDRRHDSKSRASLRGPAKKNRLILASVAA